MTVVRDTLIASWGPSVVILGENPPRLVTKAELVLEYDGGFALHWWMAEGVHQADPLALAIDPDMHYQRSIHELLSFDQNGMRGRHHNLTGGEMGVFQLNP